MQVTLEAIKKILTATDVPGADGKAVFADRFARELARFERMEREPEAWEAENLLSALGAAATDEFELACALIDVAPDPPAATARRDGRRPAPSMATLRRRFEQICG